MIDRTRTYRCAVVVTSLVVLRAPLGGSSADPRSADGLPQGVASAQVVADIGPRTILVEDVRDRLKARRQNDLAQNRLESFTAAGREKALTDLIDARLFSLAAREDGFDRRQDVARRLANVVDEVLAQQFVADTTGRLSMDDASVRAFFNAHPERFRGPDQVRARHIVVKTRAEAQSALDRLATGADFATLARERNIDSTRSTGGDLGLVKRGVMVRAFEEALFALKAGERSGIVQTSYGFHIIQVDEILPGVMPPYESVKASVRQARVDAAVEELRQRLRKKYPIRINQETLAAVDK